MFVPKVALTEFNIENFSKIHLDVLYLTYPMNFNVTPEITRNDAKTFIPITCQENAGMTGPIHAIVWLMSNESWKAEGEFNRSLQACTYGEFHVRNEVRYFSFLIK